MGMKCLICRIPSSVPQGRGDLFDPPPLCPLLGNPGVECHSSQLPLETQSFIMHDSTLWILNAIDDQKICRKTFGVFSDFFFFFFAAFEIDSNLGGVQWQHYIEGEKKILGWTLGLLPETVGIIFVSKSCLCKDAPPCHYSLLRWGGGAGD